MLSARERVQVTATQPHRPPATHSHTTETHKHTDTQTFGLRHTALGGSWETSAWILGGRRLVDVPFRDPYSPVPESAGFPGFVRISRDPLLELFFRAVFPSHFSADCELSFGQQNVHRCPSDYSQIDAKTLSFSVFVYIPHFALFLNVF